MKLSLEDLDTLTENRALCNEDGELDLPAFERLIRHHLQLYVIRTLAAAMERIERQQVSSGSTDEHTGVILFVLKLMIANMDDFGPSQPVATPVASATPSSSFRINVPLLRKEEAINQKLGEILEKEHLILEKLQSLALNTPAELPKSPIPRAVCDHRVGSAIKNHAHCNGCDFSQANSQKCSETCNQYSGESKGCLSAYLGKENLPAEQIPNCCLQRCEFSSESSIRDSEIGKAESCCNEVKCHAVIKLDTLNNEQRVEIKFAEISSTDTTLLFKYGSTQSREESELGQPMTRKLATQVGSSVATGSVNPSKYLGPVDSAAKGEFFANLSTKPEHHHIECEDKASDGRVRVQSLHHSTNAPASCKPLPSCEGCLLPSRRHAQNTANVQQETGGGLPFLPAGKQPTDTEIPMMGVGATKDSADSSLQCIGASSALMARGGGSDSGPACSAELGGSGSAGRFVHNAQLRDPAVRPVDDAPCHSVHRARPQTVHSDGKSDEIPPPRRAPAGRDPARSRHEIPPPRRDPAEIPPPSPVVPIEVSSHVQTGHCGGRLSNLAIKRGVLAESAPDNIPASDCGGNTAADSDAYQIQLYSALLPEVSAAVPAGRPSIARPRADRIAATTVQWRRACLQCLD